MDSIRFENLTFIYEKAKVPSLRDINLNIEAGSIVLIIAD